MRAPRLLMQISLVLCAACAPKPEVRTEYVTVTRDVDRIVQVRCEDKRQPLADLPDDDDELAAVSLDDPLAIFRLAQRYVAARLIYRARLKEDDAQIKGCTGQ